MLRPLSTRSARSGPAQRAGQDGFTLLELMVVVLILGSVLLVVPMNLDGFSARSRLEMGANSLVAALAGIREKAVEDGYEAHIELGWFKAEGEDKPGYRYKYTTLPAEKAMAEGQEDPLAKARREAEREWAYTEWHPLPKRVTWVGVSEHRGQWQKLNPGGKPYTLRFFASGDVERTVAIKIESEDLETEAEYRVATILVNGLTSEPSWLNGEQELRESLDDSHFSY